MMGKPFQSAGHRKAKTIASAASGQRRVRTVSVMTPRKLWRRLAPAARPNSVPAVFQSTDCGVFLSVGSGLAFQQPVEAEPFRQGALVHNGEALAGGELEPVRIRDLDDAAAIFDQPGCLQGPRDQRH